MRDALKVSISGVRGVVGDSMTPQVAAAFAQAFGAFVGHGPVLVGRDTRPTGQMLEHAVISGLQSVGCTPVLAGVAPTPTLLLLTRELGYRGGMAITASHNPGPWNALKFIGPEGLFLGPIEAEELFDIYHQQDFPLVPEAEVPPAERLDLPVRSHARRIMDYVDCEAIKACRFKVAVDGCNGVGALFSEPFLADILGCRVTSLHDVPTGIFERDPEPVPANLQALREAVVREGCQVGFAQDPDGDRLALVDESGSILIEDLTLALAVEQVLAAHEKGPVVMNLATSKRVEDVARAHGCPVTRTKIGEIHVCRKMLEAGAVIGGESNGGVIIPSVHPCRDSFTGMALILELMARTGQSLSELRKNVPNYFMVKDKVDVRADQVPVILRAVRQRYAEYEINLLDGVHVIMNDQWFHVRRSNTEPVMRVSTEAPTREQAEALRDEVVGCMGDVLGA